MDEAEIRSTRTMVVDFSPGPVSEDPALLARVFAPPGGGRPPAVVGLDANLRAAAGDRTDRLLAAVAEAGLEVRGVVDLPGGEASKDGTAQVERLLDAIDRAGLDRRSYVVAVGGGAVLDAVGLAAALAHRGVRIVRFPTTTMGQADSGVGVKNAVNRGGVKNWLGTFAVPWAVINDFAFLDTLSVRDFRAGFSEAVKVALLKDADFFADLERGAARIAAREPEPARRAIRRSARLHLEHIARGGDPFEEQEARPLDFGHWAAHRLESLSDFTIRHGEAVSLGLAIDCVYSHRVHGLMRHDLDRILTTLTNLGLPTRHRLFNDPDPLLEGIEEFRRHLGGRLTLTMIRGIAEPLETHTLETAAMREACRDLLADMPVR